MKAVLTMWRNTRMIILVAVCASIYGAALIAFKTAIPLIPGITEVRVANIFPYGLRLVVWSGGRLGFSDRQSHWRYLRWHVGAWFHCRLCR